MIIRTYKESDRYSVIALWEACGLVVPQNDPDKDIDRKTARDPDGFLVGQSDDQIIASCMAGYDGHRGWLYYMAVDPEHRGDGLGRAMVDHAVKMLCDLGCPKINLQVRSTNDKVMNFYKRLGFSPDPVESMGLRLEGDL